MGALLPKRVPKGRRIGSLALTSGLKVRDFTKNKTPKVVSVGCVGLWKHHGVLSEFGKLGKPERCVMS